VKIDGRPSSSSWDTSDGEETLGRAEISQGLTWRPSPAARTRRNDAAEDGDLGEVRDGWLGLQDEDLRDGSGVVHLGGAQGLGSDVPGLNER
jgi:hypothetical protein